MQTLVTYCFANKSPLATAEKIKYIEYIYINLERAAQNCTVREPMSIKQRKSISHRIYLQCSRNDSTKHRFRTCRLKRISLVNLKFTIRIWQWQLLLSGKINDCRPLKRASHKQEGFRLRKADGLQDDQNGRRNV
jgi:hypothetical protein